MYYRLNPKKFIRSLIVLYVLIIGIVFIKGLNIGNTKEVEVFADIIEPEVEIVKVDKVIEVPKDNIISPFEIEEIGEFIVSGFTKDDRSSNELMFDYSGITVTADPELIPYGTKIWIDGVGIRQVQPSSQNVNGNIIKVYFDSVEEKDTFGEKVINIYKIIE